MTDTDRQQPVTDDPATLPASRDEAAQEEADEQRRDVYAGRER